MVQLVLLVVLLVLNCQSTPKIDHIQPVDGTVGSLTEQEPSQQKRSNLRKRWFFRPSKAIDIFISPILEGFKDIVGKLTDCLVTGAQGCVVNHLPVYHAGIPAWSIRRGPYLGVCTCLSNLGGCYIDAARPPPRGFTCTCVKQEGWLTDWTYGCLGVGYRLAWHEETTGGTADLEQCRNGRESLHFWNPIKDLIKKIIEKVKEKIPIVLPGEQVIEKLKEIIERLFKPITDKYKEQVQADCDGYMETFMDDTWELVQKDVQIRLFAPNSSLQMNKVGLDGSREVWQQGRDVYCKIKGETPEIGLPTGFDPRLPVKGMIHGFAVDAVMHGTALIPAYQQRFNGSVNVILIDWSPLARALDLAVTDTLDSHSYMRGARNSLIVGEYLGRCLAAVSKKTGLRGRNIHLVGHSLGGQMLGTMGRSYHRWVQPLTDKLGRLTGLDPAGPGFVEAADKLSHDPRLHEARLKSGDASFVDVIHTNAAKSGPILLNLQNPLKMRLGDYGPNGDVDFYPNGGDLQIGCNGRGLQDFLRIACSHERAFHYFVDSITSDCQFPSDGTETCMGEPALQTFQGQKQIMKVNTQNWYQHRNTSHQTDLEHIVTFACLAFSICPKNLLGPLNKQNTRR